MKITKIKWNDHPVLGSLELDLTKSDGKPYDVILLAGENGVGKTSILEGLSTFLNRGSFKYFEYIEYIVDEKRLKAVQPIIQQSVEYFYDMIEEDEKRIEMHTGKHNDGGGSDNETVDNNPLNIRFNGCLFSRARADFKTDKIQATTTSELDTNKYDTDSVENFTSLKQLIVDIENQDNQEYRDINRNNATSGNIPMTEPDFYLQSKIFRFKNAFNNFFDKIKYDKVADTHGEKAILFVKNGKSIKIDDLSTGEKQIVFRGAHLLKNSNALLEGTIMVDEPELSMHPKWQGKILKYYTDLFTKNDVIKVQLLLATHSELVLKEALKDKGSCLVFALTDDNGTIRAKKVNAPTTLPTITSAETNYLAFDMVSNDYHIELYGYLQQKIGKSSIKDTDDYIVAHQYYDSAKHYKTSSYTPPKSKKPTTYETLPTYIRNAIDHPDSGNTFTDEELRMSIELLIHLCT